VEIHLKGETFKVDITAILLTIVLVCIAWMFNAVVQARAVRYASDAAIRNNAWVEKAMIRQNERRMAGLPIGPRLVEEK
jgi:hypothetical protein